PLAVVKGAFASHIFRAEGLRRLIDRHVPATEFEQLKIPLTITTADLDSGELVLFGAQPQAPLSSGSTTWREGKGARLHDALYASCTLPLYFPPGRIDVRRLGDGAGVGGDRRGRR